MTSAAAAAPPVSGKKVATSRSSEAKKSRAARRASASTSTAAPPLLLPRVLALPVHCCCSHCRACSRSRPKCAYSGPVVVASGKKQAVSTPP